MSTTERQTQRSRPRSTQHILRRTAVFLLCMAALCLLCLRAAHRLLGFSHSEAYPVLSTVSWKGTPPKYAWLPHQWLANGDLAYLEKTPAGSLQVCYRRVDAHGPQGEVRRGPVLPWRWKPTEAILFYPSPDERWIAYQQFGSRQQSQTTLLDTEGHIVQTLPGERFMLWLPDSRSFLTELPQSNEALSVHHLNTSHTETIVGLSQNQYPVPLSTIPTGSEFLIGGAFAHLASIGDSTPNYPTMRIRAFTLSQPAVAQRLWTVPVPTEMSDGMAYVSPDQRHILWVTDEVMPSTLDEWTYRVVPAWDTRGTSNHIPERRYFLSDLDGENRHRILMDIAVAEGVDVFPRWTPDSKHLSFLKNHQLYLVPVE